MTDRLSPLLMTDELTPLSDRELRIARAACEAMIQCAFVPEAQGTPLLYGAMCKEQDRLYPLPPRLRTWTDPRSGVQYRVHEGQIQSLSNSHSVWHTCESVYIRPDCILALADLLQHPTEEEK